MSRTKGPEGFGELMNIFMNIAMGIIITMVINICICLQVGMNVMTAESIIASWVCSFVVGYTVGEIGDPMGWALKLAGKMRANGFVTWVIQAVVLGTYFGTLILLGNMLISNLPNGFDAFIGGFATWWVLVEVSAVIAVFIIIKPCMALSAAVSGFNPAAAAGNSKA